MTKEEAKRFMLKERAKGRFPSDIAAKLKDSGYVSQKTGEPMRPGAISTMIRAMEKGEARPRKTYTKKTKMITMPVTETRSVPPCLLVVGTAAYITEVMRNLMYA